MDEKKDKLHNPYKEATDKTLEEINNNKLQLSEIQLQLDTLLNNTNENPSLIQRLASFWNNSSIPGKLVTSSATILPGVTAPILKTCGIFLLPGYGVGMLIAMSVSSAGLYYILNDYNDKSPEAEIKTNISKVSTVLGSFITGSINHLGEISKSLAATEHLFNEQNKRLVDNVDNIEKEMNEFSLTIQNLKTCNLSINQENNYLAEEILSLKNCNTIQGQIIDKNEKIVTEFSNVETENQLALTAKIIALENTQKSMQIKLANAQNLSDTLHETIQLLLESNVHSEQDRNNVNDKINNLLLEAEAKLNASNQRIQEMEIQFKSILEDLNQNNIIYKNFLIAAMGEKNIPLAETTSAEPVKALETTSYLSSLNLFKPIQNLMSYNNSPPCSNTP